jgi:phosphatidylglycerophosphate synthase
MDRRPLKTRSQAWVPKLAKKLVEAGYTPNQISLLSIVFAALAAASFLLSRRWPILLILAPIGIQLRLGCNLLDGVMAVEGGLKSKTGDLFNDIPDRFADVLILASAGFTIGQPALGWIAAILAVLTAYLRLLGGSLGLPQDFSGPLAKQHRMFWMTVGSLAAWIEALIFPGHHLLLLEIALAGVAIGTAYTCVRRIERLAKNLNER